MMKNKREKRSYTREGDVGASTVKVEVPSSGLLDLFAFNWILDFCNSVVDVLDPIFKV